MKQKLYQNVKKYLPIILLLVFVAVSAYALADVGNHNRYSSGRSRSSGDDSGWITFIIYLLMENPLLAIIVIVILAVRYFIKKNKNEDPYDQDYDTTPTPTIPPQVAETQTFGITAAIQQIDPNFSSEKFTTWAKEVFIKIQEAWTARNWKVIRPFESEELFSQHNTQLEEYIRNNKINVIEKIAIKQCYLQSFHQDGDKEVLTVNLRAIMRDYVIDATTKKVLESDPNRDWDMTYEMVFARKAGVKTQAGLSNKSTTNCPNCGAPTDITSAGQCEYCGSVITTGEHDWVLTNITSVN